MSITAYTSEDGKVATISINGRFDFNVHQAFREAYKDMQQPGTKYVIDLGGTEYLDSSALGMLLLLRDHAGGEKGDIQIINCRPEVKKVLTVSNFEKLFSIAC